MKIIITSLTLLAILSGCGTSDGTCCESAKVLTANKSPETPYQVKSDDPTTKIDITEKGEKGNTDTTDTTKPPTAVITSNIPEEEIQPGKPVVFSCKDSYDNDENGNEIVSCEWTVLCKKKDGYECGCTRKLKPSNTFYLTSHPNSKALIVTLTVTDDENQTNTVTKTYNFQ